MVVHVGYKMRNGKVIVYDTNNGVMRNFEVCKFDRFDSAFNWEPIFEEILAKINGEELGNFCACIWQCENDARERFIECGLKSGFKSIEIIDNMSASYFALAFQNQFKPKNGDIIWIVSKRNCYIFQKENDCAKIVDSFLFSKDTNYTEIFSNSKWKPDVIFVRSDNANFDVKKAIEIFSSCILHSFSAPGKECSALVKARITANDLELSRWNARPILYWDVCVIQSGYELFEINRLHSLPMSKTFELLNISEPVYILYDGVQREEKENHGSRFCKFEIDINGVYSLFYLSVQ